VYGLINSALQKMIREKFGDEQWEKVLKASGVPADSFLTMRSYDDAITYDLIGAASEVLGQPVEACLEMYGEYWVLETATKAYGSLMEAAGSDLVEFLGNLNTLHDRITGTFVDYVPPQFQVESLDESRHRIHYISKRQGLTPFVVGLLNGLAARFDADLEIREQEAVPVSSGEHTIFEVTVG
jgi:guanylate cyclase soluble subunit beta